MDGLSYYDAFLATHKSQLLMSGIPEYFWQTLSKKLRDEVFDAGTWFQVTEIVYEESAKQPYDPTWTLIALQDIDRLEPNNIFLVDHTWTFKANKVKSTLSNTPRLLERLCNFMRVTAATTEEKIEAVSKNIWKYANTYSIGNLDINMFVEDRVPVWYILDELGSSITHSDNPNFRTVPFVYVPQQVVYTLLFPIENVGEGQFVTRNYVEGNYWNPLQREAMLIPWQHYDYFDEDFTHEEPNVNYFLEGHIVETLPNLELLEETKQSLKGKLKVYSEYTYINEYLTSPEFEIVDNEDDADILWYLNHFKNFKELSEHSPNKFVNQFPFEYLITIKDLLAIVARRCANDNTHSLEDTMETSPPWLPTTFNMKTELSKLVAYYMQRKKHGLDNHWICKPFNLARGLDTYITDNLDFLCRLPLSGPKIAQKYIENPVMFKRSDVGLVKFDIRYVIILKSVNPTEVYIYKNFFLRLCNKVFALNNFEDYEQHFTVMNYNENAPLHELLCDEFKEAWTEQYGDYDWAEIEKSIFKMFSHLFTAATSKAAPCGIAKSPQSRSLYAADVMLSWQKVKNKLVMQPKLLEINWMPDCRRACEYYPNFYNDIFSVMFLNKEVETCIKIL